MADAIEPSTSEERLIAATVGKVKPLNGSITLAPYSPEWPLHFEVLEQQIRQALGSKAVLVEHIGSTSVPGLCAKPIIDIVLVVANSADEGAYVPPLEAAGYVLRIREPDWFEHRMFKAAVIKGNVHVFSQGSPEIERHLAFRDRLRSNDDDRVLYARTKQELASRTWKHVQDYADAKGEVVKAILARALAAR